MAAPVTEARATHIMQVSVIVLVCTVALNIAFHFLADAYYADRARTTIVLPGMKSTAQTAFGLLTTAVAATVIAGQFARRLVAHGIAGAGGLLALAAALAGMSKFHPVLPAALLLLGSLMLAMTYFSAATKSRSAWAFLVATCSVGSLVTLFGATKVRNAMDFNLWYALVIPALLVVASVMLVQLADDYAEA